MRKGDRKGKEGKAKYNKDLEANIPNIKKSRILGKQKPANSLS